MLAAVVRKFGGGPVGLSTLAAAVGEEPDTIEDVVEPYLLQLGFLQRTPRGRQLTAQAYRYLGLPPPVVATPQPDLLDRLGGDSAGPGHLETGDDA